MKTAISTLTRLATLFLLSHHGFGVGHLAAQGPTEIGHYSAPQANRGQALYSQHCTSCHGSQLNNGSVSPLAGPVFVQKWSSPGRTLGGLSFILRQTMPPGASGTLTPGEYTDILAYILQQNGYPPGQQELPSNPSVIQAIKIEAKEIQTTAADVSSPKFIPGDSLDPTGRGPTQNELNTAFENSRDWLYHTHDYSGRRYSGLSQISSDNVGELSVSCAFQMGEQRNFQTGPLVYQGVMYLTTVHSTFAIDAGSCRPLWQHTWSPKDQESWQNNRGVAIKDGRVVRGTADGYLFALDALTGKLLWARQVANPKGGETFTMPPLIFEELILIGPAGSENNIIGWVGAFRLDNGEPVWRFKTIPALGDPGSETWSNPDGIPMGGGAVWTPFSLDHENGLLYVAATNPAPDFAAQSRPGSNLYTNSLIALDVRTGKLQWYDQLVPNDAHDWDLTQVSPLFRTRISGLERDLIATVGKDGILRVLDREKHERLYEVPVTTLKNEDVPITREGVHVCPGSLGGVEWNGPAYHPGTNLLYVPAVDRCGIFALDEEIRYVDGALYLGGSFVRDPTDQGWLTAVDASKGVVSWRYRSSEPLVAAVTATGGGLVLTGELTGDFVALDASSGKVLYRFNTGGPIGGGIVTYEVRGKQYIAVMSGLPSGFWIGENPGSPTAFIFSLP